MPKYDCCEGSLKVTEEAFQKMHILQRIPRTISPEESEQARQLYKRSIALLEQLEPAELIR